jgi:hypothetical protein
MIDQNIKQTIGKVPLENLLMFKNALMEVSKVREYGLVKYPDPLSYKKSPEGLLKGALMRHLFDNEDEERAEDSDCYHLAHLICNGLMMLETRLEKKKNKEVK